MTTVGSTVFFGATTPGADLELWKTDGTSSGTALVRDLVPVGASPTGHLSLMANVNGTLFFVANTPGLGAELWKSDGTSTGTMLVKDIVPGASSATPRSFIAHNGLLFFTTASGSPTTDALWRSDGTEAGTFPLTDAGGGAFRGQTDIYCSVGNVLYFAGNSAATGIELWRTDGASSGTFLVHDLRAGTASSSPRQPVNLNGTLVFAASGDSTASTLYRSDGTSAGTVPIPAAGVPTLGASGLPMSILNDVVYFVGNDGLFGDELWRTDGTSAGTSRISDIRPGTAAVGINNLTTVGEQVFFNANDGTTGDELWRTDGTSSGTRLVRNISPAFANASPANFRTANNLLFFTANQNNIPQLWRSDGTSSGTFQATAFNFDSIPISLTVGPDGVYFRGNHPDTGNELWMATGSSSGTRLVRDVNPATRNSNIAVTGFQDSFYIATGGASTISNGLFRSNGTAAGTQSLWPNAVNGVAYFGNDFIFSPGNLLRYNPAGVISVIHGMGGDMLTPVGNTLFYANGATGGDSELWATDGTSSGTRLVRDISIGTLDSNPQHFTAFNGKLYFSARDGSELGTEIYRSDGTSSGTFLLHNIMGNGGSYPDLFTVAGGKLYFAANSDTHGRELWRTDGTTAARVTDINPAGNHSGILHITAAPDGTLYFFANNATQGKELWKSNGTATGTSLVADIFSGVGSSATATDPKPVLVNGILYFAANDSIHGSELWRSDGTSSGTWLVADINPAAGSSIGSLIAVNDVLYLSANDGVHGSELWRSDGTSAGTTMIDLEFGTAAAPANFFSAGERLVVQAYRLDVGIEPFTLREDRTAPFIATITAPSGSYTTGQSVNITVTFNEPVTLSGGSLLLTLNSGATVSVAPFANSATAVATYIVSAGDTTSDLDVTSLALSPGASITDEIGFEMTLTLPFPNDLQSTSNVIVNPLPPTTVTLVTVNAGSSQRSRLTSIVLDFAVPIPAEQLAHDGAITLTRTSGPVVRLSTGASGAAGRIALSTVTGLVTSLTLTFDNADGAPVSAEVEHGSLADGYWQLSIQWLSFTSTLNNPQLRRLFGDINGDGTVDGPNDFAAFGNVFGTTTASSPFDFDANGAIDGPVDFAQFGARFGITL